MRRVGVLLLALATACTAAPTASDPTPLATNAVPAPSPTRLPSRTPAPTFSAARAMRTVEALAALGPREASSATYRRAADLVANAFAELGYRVSRQRFDVPAGSVDDVSVGAGRSQNVIASPPGFDGRSPHLVVGAHLDTVPDSPGANDNASGVAVMLEVARLAAARSPRLPVRFIAFGAEERRRQSASSSRYTIGAGAYLDARSKAQRRAIAGYLNLDMVGNGPAVVVIGSGPLFAHTLARARRADIPTSLTTTELFSDHIEFADAGITVSWLWAGDHPSLHTPEDVQSVVRRGALRRAGRLAWETIRTFRG